MDGVGRARTISDPLRAGKAGLRSSAVVVNDERTGAELDKLDFVQCADDCIDVALDEIAQRGVADVSCSHEPGPAGLSAKEMRVAEVAVVSHDNAFSASASDTMAASVLRLPSVSCDVGSAS